MVYKKRAFKRRSKSIRRYATKKRWSSKRRTPYNKIAQRRAGVFSRRRIMPEWHQVDVPAFGPATVNAGSFNCFSLMAQGSGPTNRDGLNIQIKSLYWRYTVQAPLTATDGRLLRMILFIQKDAAVTPTAALLLAAPTDICSPLNNTTHDIKNYVILMDKVISVKSWAAGQDPTLFFTYYKKFNMVSKFFGANIGDILDNHIWLFCYSDTTNAALAPTLSITSRLRFIDS
nr:MAG: capsid protein [Cressdnaviricota sp.]